MRQVTTGLLALATATLLVGCGGYGERERVHFATGADPFSVLMQAGALPEGHPPVDRYHRALPDGHPPVAGYGHGLPQGHPVCPAGRHLLERGLEDGQREHAAGPRLISI